MMIKTLNCELDGKQHTWLKETVYGEYEFYGTGHMNQRRCTRCQVIDYIDFKSIDGYVTEIMVKSDDDFEKLCEELENR